MSSDVAIGLARLGLKVGWVSRLGTDSMARYLLKALQREGIDCSHVVCDASQRTGLQLKGRVAGGGDPQVENHRKGSAASLFQPEQTISNAELVAILLGKGCDGSTAVEIASGLAAK